MPKPRQKPTPERQAEITRKRLATTAANRRARRLAMTPEERAAEVAAVSERYRQFARRCWIVRRERAGLPPGPAERTKPVQVYLRDLEVLRTINPDAKRALRHVLESLRLGP